jgi:methyl halide transferase
MKITKFDKRFWDNKYLNNEIGWDLGEISIPLKDYIDQLADKSIRILIPGAGNSHEAEYLHNQGFKNVIVADISPTAIDNFKNRVSSFPKNNILCVDFFQIKGQFDLILEQTFFCAIHPELRANYSLQAQEILNKGGKIAGLLFNFPLTENGPPFGGDKQEYEKYFSPNFDIQRMELSYNSIMERTGKEFFVLMIKK